MENPIALYVDGVYYSSMSASTLALSNIASVDIARGPQGTLFGRNATGGLIQITTRDPTSDFAGHVSAGYGNYQTLQGNLYLGGSVQDHLLADLSLDVSDPREGYGRNAYTGEYVNRTQDVAVRSKWLYVSPAGTQIQAIADFENTEFVPAYVPAPGTTPLGGSPYTGPAQGMNGYTQPDGLQRQGGISAQIRRKFFGAEFMSLTAFRRNYLHASIDGGLVTDPAYVLNVDIVDTHDQWTQEFQFLSDPASHVHWVAGTYFLHSEGRYDPVRTSGGLLAPLAYADTRSRQNVDSAAFFGQITASVTPETDAVLGIRYTEEHRRFDGSVALIGLDGSEIAPPSTDAKRGAYRKPTWRFAFERHFGTDGAAYVSYDRGVKSGGFNDDLVPTTAYAHEVLDAYEVGSKAEFYGRRLRLNIASFLYDYRNIQAVTYPAGLEQIYNGAAAKLYGVDLELSALVTDRLRITSAVESLHSRFTSFPNADFTTPAVGGGTSFGTFDARGRQLPFAPRWTGDLSVNYRLLTAFGAIEGATTYRYNSGWFAEPDNRLRQGAFGILNATVTWQAPRVGSEVRLWAKNLTNVAYLVALASQANGDFAQYAPPRTYGVAFTRYF